MDNIVSKGILKPKYAIPLGLPIWSACTACSKICQALQIETRHENRGVSRMKPSNTMHNAKDELDPAFESSSRANGAVRRCSIRPTAAASIRARS